MLYRYKGIDPVLGKDVYIAPNATVIGDVHLGDGASVWFGAVIRGDVFPIRIGARTNVQDNSVVHVTGGKAATTIGDDVTIGHMVLVHGATVGNGCLLGMGAVLLDNCEIGDESVVGAGSLVTEGKKFPPRSLVVGSPARLVRTLSDDDMAWVKRAAGLYVRHAQTYMRDVTPIEGPVSCG